MKRRELDKNPHAENITRLATQRIKVSNVEIKLVDLDETMIRAIARQAEAERTRRAKIINAEGRAAGGAEAARSRPNFGAGGPFQKTFDQDQNQKICTHQAFNN
jgi:hypothetical protein